MDLNNGKPLSPWKVPSRISLKRIRHKINGDLNVQVCSSTTDKNSSKQQSKRNRLMINKFALARSMSETNGDENNPSISNENLRNETKINDEDLLAKLHKIMPPPSALSSSLTTSSLVISNEMHFNSTTQTLSFDPTSSLPETNYSKSSDEIFSSFPTDWSLKSSCRFVSSQTESFLSNLMKLRSSDESIALDYICSSIKRDNDKAFFRSLTSYWSYPHLSWLKLFPRSQQEQQTTSNNNFNALDEHSQLSLQDEWKSSFQSLFQSFRTRHCPYFYMCTHTFNILFRDDISSQIIAIINPTTSGLRSTLEREGIEFTMADGGDPLNNSSTKINDDVEHRQDNDEDEDDEFADENDLNCAQWLEEMGLKTTSTNTSSERKVFSSKTSTNKQKIRSTTILIRDVSSVNSLFNFLLNKSQRLCIPLTGPLTGIPPTLISPRPFLNSTLKYLNVHFQSNSMLTIEGGPILPDRLQNLWNLFQEKLSEVQLNCFHVERTSAFNFDKNFSRTIKQIHVDSDRQLRVQFIHL